MGRLPGRRWTLLAVAAAVMGVAGTYQFVWSSIRLPIGARLGVTEASLGTVFTLFVVFQTVSQFPAGWVRDRYGPRVPLVVGAAFLVAGYVGLGTASGIPGVYAAYALGGIGAGVAYTVALNTAVKWFSDRRGLATGIVGMAYGGVSFLAIPLVRGRIRGQFEATVLALGVVAGVVAVVGAVVLRDPERNAGESATSDGESETGDSDRHSPNGDPREESPTKAPEGDAASWRSAVRTWQFWHLYLAFVVVNGVGLMVIGKVVSFAETLELSAATATGAASLVAIGDASGLALIGGLSDRFGREATVAVSLVGSGIALCGAVVVGDGGFGIPFVAFVFASAFFRSPVFAVFPTLVGEYYGPERSSENYAVLYTAKLWGGVGGGVVASRAVVTLGWSEAFAVGGVLIALAGGSLFFLRPP
jgi:OFA family oxalate/formate antiporter-like MFS transporter